MIVTTFFVAAASAAGCTSKASGPKQQGSAAVQLDKAKTETKQAAQAMRDYAYAEKAEFVDSMKKELVNIQEELDRLGTKAEEASGAAKADANVKLKAVHEKWMQTKKQLDRAESATESTWDDVKSGFKQSYTDLQDSFAKTRQWLSDKIAP
jgi:chromosome segregation ATPase